jgi:hypothetical protein
MTDFRPCPKPKKKPKVRKPFRPNSRKPEKTTAENWYANEMTHLPCWCCGRYGPLDLHHQYHDRKGSHKKNMFSCMPMLVKCHSRDFAGSFHRNPTAFIEAKGHDSFGIIDTLIKIYGDDYSIDH